MRKQIKKLVVGLILACFCVNAVWAEEEGTNTAVSSENPQKTQTEGQVSSLQVELAEKKEILLNTKSKIKELQEELAPLRERIDTLQGQLMNLDYLMNLSEKKVENIQEQVRLKELDLGQVMEEAEYYAVQFDQEKDKLRTYANLLYLIESQFFDFEKMEINPTKLLLAQGAVSDTAQPLNYLSIAQGVERAMVAKLADTQDIYEVKQQELNEKRKSLRVLKTELEGEQRDLVVQQEAKENLLALTEGQEGRYQQMLREAEEQEEQVANDINALQSDYAYYSLKLSQLNNTTQFSVYSNTVEYGDLDAINRLLGEKHQSLAWPLDPSRGITAYFHDESYKSYFGVPHNAIDLRAYQGTTIHAPADGVVYKVRDNGYGYSYLILAHRDNILTVYGHVSEFKVQEGDIVRQGDEIALSGGMPGTTGAGTMTTGPHLHFEVYDNGAHVDPLDYLPVLDLPAEYIPQKYLDQLNEADLDTLNTANIEEVQEEEEVIDEQATTEVVPEVVPEVVEVAEEAVTGSGN